MATFALHRNDTVPRDLNVVAPPSVSSSNRTCGCKPKYTGASRVEAFGRPVGAEGSLRMCNTQQSGEYCKNTGKEVL